MPLPAVTEELARGDSPTYEVDVTGLTLSDTYGLAWAIAQAGVDWDDAVCKGQEDLSADTSVTYNSNGKAEIAVTRAQTLLLTVGTNYLTVRVKLPAVQNYTTLEKKKLKVVDQTAAGAPTT